MPLRDYQVKCSDAVFEEFKENDSTAVVCPTGTGKTVIMADIVRRIQPKKSMIVAGRKELIYQARNKIQEFTGLDSEIEMAELYASTSLFHASTVVISTVQSLISQNGDRKRMGRFKPDEFGLLIIDECHHATSPSYKNIIHYFRQNPALKVVGFTATPDRADEEALGQVFDSVAYDYEILDAIHDGWLVPIDQQMVSIHGLDFSQIHTTAGDLNGAELAKVMEQEENLLGVVGASIEIVGDRRAIAFAVSIAQAESMCNIFNRYKPGCAGWVCGETREDLRKQLLDSFSAGKVQIVCNCGVLTEGFDDPGVEVIIMARATKSRALYSQMLGRSTRPLAGVVDGLEDNIARKAAIAASPKPSCLVVDFVGNSGKHKLMTSADILGGKVSEEAIARAVIRAKSAGQSVRIADLLDEEEDNLQKETAERKRIEEERKAKLVARVSYKKRFVNPFDAFEISPMKERGWDRVKPLTDKQRALLMRQGVNPDEMPAGQCRQLINEMFRRWDKKLCTYKQAALLKRFGYAHITKDLTMDAASKLIDSIAKGGWRLPPSQTEMK